MANPNPRTDHLNHKLTAKEQSMGGKASGEVRKRMAELKKTLELILAKKNKKGTSYEDNITMGLIANAINKNAGGNPEAYKTIAKLLGQYENEPTQTQTPKLEINIVNNEHLEEELWKGNEQQ